MFEFDFMVHTIVILAEFNRFVFIARMDFLTFKNVCLGRWLCWIVVITDF